MSIDFQEVAPDSVFAEGYWGTIHPEPAVLNHNTVRAVDRMRASLLMALVVPKIMTGTVMGPEFKKGRFNPADRDLSRSSALNIPGTVLLVDRESLRPLSTFMASQLRDPDRQGRGVPSDQEASTRELLRADMHRYPFFGRLKYYFDKGKFIYANDKNEYQRTVSIVSLVPDVIGTASPREACTLHFPALGDSGRPLVYLSAKESIELNHDLQIGETYESYNDLRAYIGITRVVSLEICRLGQSAEERSPLFSDAFAQIPEENIQ